MITVNALTNNGLFIGIVLITFLVLKEVFSADINKNEKIRTFISIINIALIPLIVIFLIIVVYNVNSALSNL